MPIHDIDIVVTLLMQVIEVIKNQKEYFCHTEWSTNGLPLNAFQSLRKSSIRNLLRIPLNRNSFTSSNSNRLVLTTKGKKSPGW